MAIDMSLKLNDNEYCLAVDGDSPQQKLPQNGRQQVKEIIFLVKVV